MLPEGLWRKAEPPVGAPLPGIIHGMHLLIPFASALSEAATHVLRDLPLPHLARLLGRLTATARDEASEYSLSPPHERALAAVWAWRAAGANADADACSAAATTSTAGTGAGFGAGAIASDGCLPFAARAALADGIDVGDLAWGLLTPAHWHVGRDHVTLAAPEALNLNETESRALFEAVRELFESEGFTLIWGAPLRWYAAHPSLDGLACASLDRVIGRNVDLWLPNHRQARLVRRLQSEVQLLLYPHPLTDAREERGELAVNSFWLSGCGRFQPSLAAGPNPDLVVDDTLRGPVMAQTWDDWADAWRALDAGPLASLLARAQAGQSCSLTLCGERSAQRFDSLPQSMWQRLGRRWNAPETHAVIGAL